ncbi:MAG TPA: UDP-glucose 4-epimerase GalE [Acidimicrobiia bacterium]|nr:UDP-glucose 4-epimerase GalE [Acidimicrobiia bacterium]
MSVLVTGGAGYIGSHTVRALRARGADVVVLDSLELGHVEAVLDAPLEVGDIADAALVADIVQRHAVDAVVHFAGYKAAGESMEVPEKYFENNVAKTARLLDTLHAAGVAQFVFSSSCSVYGTPSTLPVDEQHPTGPESPYAESKHLVERMLRWFDDCHGLRSVSLRYFNAAGASADARLGEDSPRPLNLVPLAMLAALGKIDALSVYGTDYPTPDGTCVRDYIHVDDLADAHVRALGYLADGGPSTALNVGTGQGSSVLEVIDGAKAVSGIDFPVKLVERRPGDPSAVWADNTRVREVLGWQAEHALDEILASAWAWHSTHPEGYATSR